MLIAIDLGNTNITTGVFNSEILLKNLTCSNQNLEEFFAFLKRETTDKNTKIVMSSVVPEISKVIAKEIPSVLELNWQSKSDVIVATEQSQTTGIDRIVNATAAKYLYPLPAITVDFGTALVIDYIDAESRLLGGVIMPGSGLAVRMLAEKTASLPKLRLEVSSRVIGRHTREAINSGIFYGWLSMYEGLVEKFQAEQGKVKSIILTGGDSELFAKYTCLNVIHNANLTLQGIRILGEQNLV